MYRLVFQILYLDDGSFLDLFFFWYTLNLGWSIERGIYIRIENYGFNQRKKEDRFKKRYNTSPTLVP